MKISEHIEIEKELGHNLEKIKRQFARRKNLNPEDYDYLSNDSSFKVRVIVARNPSTPQYVLERIVKTTPSIGAQSIILLRAVAKNPSTSSHLLSTLLIKSRSTAVRKHVLFNYWKKVKRGSIQLNQKQHYDFIDAIFKCVWR